MTNSATDVLEQIPSTANIVIKQKFKDRYEKLTDWEEFKKYSLSFLRRCIRVNTLRASVKEVQQSIEAKDWKLEPIPWCKEGFWISHPERRDVGNLLEFHLGKIYVQEAASMIPPLILDPKPGDVVLDMCAAPGSKTTQMAAMMQDKGVLIANDYKGKRLQSLGINLQRCGITSSIVTLMHGKRFKDFQFDKILVDAPCSGTGTIRKSLKTLRIWNEGMIRKIAKEQINLLENAFLNLKPGGDLVYSTCSLEPEENEGVVHLLLQKFSEAKTSPPLNKFKEVVFHPDIKNTLRIWPQDNDTQGFFVAKIIKEGATHNV